MSLISCSVCRLILCVSPHALYEYEHTTSYKHSRHSLSAQGQVRVIVGKEDLEFQGGPFSYYGVPALMQPLAPPSGSLRSKKKHNRTNCKFLVYPNMFPYVLLSQISKHCSIGLALNRSAPPIIMDIISVDDLNVTAGGNHFMPDYNLIASSDVKYIKVLLHILCSIL